MTSPLDRLAKMDSPYAIGGVSALFRKRNGHLDIELAL
jgi:hypothetical protein